MGVTLTTAPGAACCSVETVVSTTAGACFSADRRHRPMLWRSWTVGPLLVCVLLNPSIADADDLDRTLSRVQDFAMAWGFGGMVIVNAFSFVSTKSQRLLDTDFADAVGPDNDDHIALALTLAADGGRVMVGWGGKLDRRELKQRVAALRNLIGDRAFCWDLTLSGQPEHPLYQKKTVEARVYLWPEGRSRPS